MSCFSAPDWRDASKYPSSEEHPSLAFWAWQFLRRNKDYQAEWNGYAARLRAIAERMPDLQDLVRSICEPDFSTTDDGKRFDALEDDERNRLHSLFRQLNTWIYDPPKLPSESDNDWARRSRGEGARPRLMPLDRSLGKKWGIERIVHPSHEYHPLWMRFLFSGTRFTLLPVGGGRSSRFDDGEIDPLFGHLISPLFDLRFPKDVLRGQFEALLAERESRIASGDVKPFDLRPERSLSLFREYVRALDARDSGATVSDMAGVFLPHQDIEGARKSVRNWLNRAEEIRAEEYRLLPAYATIKKPKS